MRRFFRAMSPFRAIFTLLLLASLGVGLYEAVRGQSIPAVDHAGYEKRTRDAMRDIAVGFADRIFVIEETGIELVERCERFADNGGVDDGQLRKFTQTLLTGTLAGTDTEVEGVGVSAVGKDGAPRLTAFLSREDARIRALPLVRHAGDGYEAIDTAREINLERSLTWRLAARPSESGGERVSTFLLVSSREQSERFDGESIVHADLGWLGDILVALEKKGVRQPFFLTPHDEAIWRENGGLHCAGLVLADSTANLPARRAMPHAFFRRETSGGVELELLGTGWRVAADGPTGGSLLIASIITAALALCALVLESRLRGDGNATGTRHSEKDAVPGPLTGLAAALFKYRLTNPDQERIDSELRVARTIQFSLLPTSFPAPSEWREYDMYAVLHPAREIGGDYYDFFALSADRFVLVVGDVSGKGMPASLYMAVCRTAFRALAGQARNPGELLSSINDMLVRDNKSGLYVTLACFFIDMPTGKCEYALGGHPAPIWRRAGERVGELLDHPRETFVGMKAGVDYPVGRIQLTPGDTLLLFTDGVTEARSASGDELEHAGLYAMFDKAVGYATCREIVERLDAGLTAFTGGGERADDVTLLAFRYWGPGGKRMTSEPERSIMRQVPESATTPSNVRNADGKE